MKYVLHKIHNMKYVIHYNYTEQQHIAGYFILLYVCYILHVLYIVYINYITCIHCISILNSYNHTHIYNRYIITHIYLYQSFITKASCLVLISAFQIAQCFLL